MSDRRLKYLFFVSKPYSFPILEPVDNYINKYNVGETAWYTASTAKKVIPNGKLLKSTIDVLEFAPDAVLAPGNLVPNHWPGIKVQLFHGLDDEVKGFYKINGQFDLYCTPGFQSTSRFKRLAQKYGYFTVEETGWSKLDPLFNKQKNKIHQNDTLIKELGFNKEIPILIYAPTFPPKYTSAEYLFEAILKLKDQYQWIIKFHSLMDANIQDKYIELESSTLKVVTADNIIPYLEISDILISDTSSVVYEYLPLDRPIITYNAIARKDKGININDSIDLHGAIIRSLNDPSEYSDNRKYYLNEIHPYTDGRSSERVVKTINNLITNNIVDSLKQKPYNWLRNYRTKKLLSELD